MFTLIYVFEKLSQWVYGRFARPLLNIHRTATCKNAVQYLNYKLKDSVTFHFTALTKGKHFPELIVR